MVKTKRKTFAASVKAARIKHAEETKGMSAAERYAYHEKQAAKGRARIQAAMDSLPADEGQRELQLLIRLTKAEKEILERDAAAEQAKSVSALVRSRSLRTESPLDVILFRLDSVVKRLNKIEKILEKN